MKLAAIGLVVVLFVAAFAGYWAIESRAPASPAPAVAFTYDQSGRYFYVATLSNNTLYNQSTLTPGNGTLFTAITTWVNLSYTYGLIVSRPVTAAIDVALTVQVTTAAWTKSIGTAAATSDFVDASSGVVTVAFDLSVANVTTLVTAIEKQTGYSPSYYNVVLSPSVAAAVIYGTNATSLTYFAPLSLNFSAGQIVPTHLTSSSPGTYVPDGPKGDPPASLPIVPYALLLGAVAAAGVLGYLTYGAYRREGGPDLETITRPFKEAIVETMSSPPTASRVEVPSWTDLVKVADTLGVPILRVRSGARSDSAALFYVLSDGLAYVYHYGTALAPRPAPPANGAPTARASPTPASSPRPTVGVAARRETPTAPVPQAWSLEAFVRSAEGVQRTLQGLAPSRTGVGESRRLLLRSIELARRGRLDAAWLTLEGARFRADAAAPARPTVGPSAAGPGSWPPGA